MEGLAADGAGPRVFEIYEEAGRLPKGPSDFTFRAANEPDGRKVLWLP